MLFIAFALCRYLSYSASFLLFGVSAMLALSGSDELRLRAYARFGPTLRVLAVIGVLAVLCLLALQAATIADDWRVMSDPAMLTTVAFQTRYGQAWCLRMMAVILVLGVFFCTRASQTGLRALVAAIALLPLGLSGHAAMEEGWEGLAHAINDVAHCLAAGFWLGSLPVFLYFLTLSREPAHRLSTTDALLRFSIAGHIAVAVLLTSGVVNALMILEPGGLDPASHYQQLLLLKVLLALGMVGMALFNRYRWVPLIRVRPGLALARIRRNATIELFMGAAIVMIVSFLGLMAPQ